MDWIAIAQMIVIKLCTQRYTYFHFILYNFWKRLFIYLKILNAPFTESRHNSRPNLLQNLISAAGYLKTRICGGGAIWPPLQIPCLMFKYDKWCIIGKLSCTTFRICKKICKFEKIEFFIAKSSYIVKMCAKKMKNYTFLKSPWPCHFKYTKIFAKF